MGGSTMGSEAQDMNVALWPEEQKVDPKYQNFSNDVEMMSTAIKTLTERYISTLACRPKEYIVVPAASWPTWPTASEAEEWHKQMRIQQEPVQNLNMVETILDELGQNRSQAEPPLMWPRLTASQTLLLRSLRVTPEEVHNGLRGRSALCTADRFSCGLGKHCVTDDGCT